jgi:superfamily II DNA or RNA helicase
MIRFLIAKKIAPLKKASSFRLPIISSPSVYKMVTTDLLFQIPRHGHEFIPQIKASAEAPVSLGIPIRTQPTQVFLPASIHEAFAKIRAEVQSHNLVLERAGVIYPPGHWDTSIQAPEILNLFVVFSPYVRTDGKNYSAQAKHDRGQLGLFGGKLGPKKKNGARVFGGMSTGKGAVVTVWDALWPLLQPPLNFAFSEYLDLPSTLRPYQYDGVRALADNESFLLGDDMGTGKTVQAVVALRILVQKAKVHKGLIVCPLAVLPTWADHLERWGRILNFSVVRGSNAERRLQWNTPAHVYVTTYETLREDVEIVCDPSEGMEFDLVIADEVQKIKNPGTGTSQALKRLDAERRWGLSGTPYENRIDDVISIFEFLRPGLLHSEGESFQSVKAKIKPFFLRRTKEVLGDELPRKIQNVVWLDLGNRQREAYGLAEREGIIRLREEGEHVTVTHVLALLGKLKEICNFDPLTGESAKLDSLTEFLEEVTAEGNKGLVFTQYIGSGVQPITGRLEKYGVVEYSGRTNTDQKRRVALERFAEDQSCRVLVCTQAAAGLGLNLTAANYVFHFDHWWNPARTSQAEDRVHRIGQEKPVFVYHLWIKDTVEERIFKILARKRAEFEEVIGGISNTEGSGLSEDELFELFGLERPPRKKGVAAEVPQTRFYEEAKTPPEPPSRAEPLDVDAWPMIRETELTLRKCIRSVLTREYAGRIGDRIFEHLGPTEAQSIRLRISHAQQRYGGSGDFAPSDSPLDYVYIGQLVDLVSREWLLFRPIFGEKRFLADKVKDIASVRNDEAHFRNIPQVEKMRAYVACADILTKLKETPR